MYQIIRDCFSCESIYVLTPLNSHNATDLKSSLRVVLACLVSEQWFDKDDSFYLPLKGVSTQL